MNNTADTPENTGRSDGTIATACSASPATAAAHWNPSLVVLYQQHFVELSRMARRLVDTEAAAEEVVQDAFVRFHTTRNQPAAGKELSYLRSIVLNQARSVLRRRQVARNWQPETPRHSPSGESEGLARIESDDLRTALATLPTRQRQVLTCRHIFGLSERETAATLAISVGSVKTHASRGRSTLRGQLSVA